MGRPSAQPTKSVRKRDKKEIMNIIKNECMDNFKKLIVESFGKSNILIAPDFKTFISRLCQMLEYQHYFAESTIFFASIKDKPYFSLNDLTVFTSVESFNISFASFFIPSYSPVFFQ